MHDNSDILDGLDALSTRLSQTRIDVTELADSYRTLADAADAALYDTDTANEEIVKLTDAIESGEISLDEEALRTLSQLLDANDFMAQHADAFQLLYDHVEEASRAFSDYERTPREVTDASRQLR